MQPELRTTAATASLLAVLALLAGCAGLGAHDTGEAPRLSPAGVDRDTQVAVLLAGTLQSLQRLVNGSPAQQAEIIATARQGYERAPGGSAQLRYALVLATPGHPTRDPERARQLLRALAAKPEMLAPVERAYTLVQLAVLDRELGLAGDNQRLQAGVVRAEQELAGSARRLQVETDESARLRKLLDDAQAKLTAIAALEKNLSERKPNTEGRKK
jgi:hypothetical protein